MPQLEYEHMTPEHNTLSNASERMLSGKQKLSEAEGNCRLYMRSELLQNEIRRVISD